MPIKAVILDVGGVLSRVVDFSIFANWEEQLELPPRTLVRTIFYSDLSVQATLGQISMDELWTGLASELGLAPEDAQTLQADVWRGSEWNTPFLEYVRSLRPRYQTAVLSNAWPNARGEMASQINEDAFDLLVFSAEEGIAKPDPEIYRRTLERLGVEAAEALFVDDRRENVDAARALGMHGVLFAKTEEAMQAIEEVLASAL